MSHHAPAITDASVSGKPFPDRGHPEAGTYPPLAPEPPPAASLVPLAEARPLRGIGSARVSIQIERLVIDCIPLTAAQGTRLRSALERELARLLEARDGARSWRAGAVPALTAPGIEIRSARPDELGRQIARSVFASLQQNA